MNKPTSGPTIRLKLTLLYGGLFLVAGLILISISYALVRRELTTPNPPGFQVGADRDDDDDDDEADEDPDERENRARREERTNAIREIRRQSIFALVFTSSGCLVLGWFVAGKVLSPIRHITEHAQHASAATLDERINLHGPSDELKNLADTFDAMLDRLQAAFDAQRGFAAQASHELRTPLAVIRAEAEVAKTRSDLSAGNRASIDSIMLAVDRSETLIDSLLALSRSESTMLAPVRLDMASLVGDVVASLASEADRAGVRLDLELGDAWVMGDASLLERLVGNLVQNGIHYNREAGNVRVSIETIDGTVQIGVVIPTVTDFDSAAGKGALGTVEGRRVLLGSAAFMSSHDVDTTAVADQADRLRGDGATAIFIGVNDRVAGVIAIADPVKETTSAALQSLRAEGIDVVMLTGDNRVTAEAVARTLGIDRVEADVLPDHKSDVVKRLREQGRVVAMAGDGVNDAPALAAADVGLAMSSGTDVAMESAGVTLLRGDLTGIVRARQLSEATMSNIRQNLVFAFVYNAAGIPIAAGALYPVFGWLLSPMIAAAAMALSSVSVITNALRLRTRHL